MTYSNAFTLRCRLACFATFLLAAPLRAADLTLEQIGAAMEAAEAQFDTLSIRYTYREPVAEAGVFQNQWREWDIEVRRSRQLGWVFQTFDEYLTGADAAANAPRTLTDRRMALAFDGNVTTVLTPAMLDAKGKPRPPRAIIYPGFHGDTLRFSDRVLYVRRSHYNRPYLTTFTDPRIVQKITDRSAVINGTPVIKIEGIVEDNQGRIEVFVAPGRGFLAMAERWYRPDGTMTVQWQLDDLFEIKPGVWFPRKVLGGDQSTPESTFVTTVKSISIDPLPRSQFKVELPPKTRVSDLVTKTNYFVADVAPMTTKTTTKEENDQAERAIADYVKQADRQANPPATQP